MTERIFVFGLAWACASLMAMVATGVFGAYPSKLYSAFGLSMLSGLGVCLLVVIFVGFRFVVTGRLDSE